MSVVVEKGTKEAPPSVSEIEQFIRQKALLHLSVDSVKGATVHFRDTSVTNVSRCRYLSGGFWPVPAVWSNAKNMPCLSNKGRKNPTSLMKATFSWTSMIVMIPSYPPKEAVQAQ